MLTKTQIQNKKDVLEFVCLILKEIGLSDQQIASLDIPSSRKTICKYLKQANLKYKLNGLSHKKPRKFKIIPLGGTREIEDIQANREIVNPSGAERFTNIKKYDDFKNKQ